MNFINRRRKITAIIVASLFLTNLSLSAKSMGDKVKPEEVIAKHIEALGSAQARSSTRSRIVAGTSLMNLKTGGRGNSSGPALLASQNGRVLLKAEFNSATYPFEKFGFDGGKLHARQYAPGIRSPLAEFFLSHDTTFSEGLIGGTLSSAWPLLNLTERGAKVQYAGTEKIDGRQAQKLKYTPRQGTELKITIYIDAETFQHLRTVYEREIAAPMGTVPAASASMRGMSYKLVEDFRDFRKEGDLTLPHTYTIEYSVSRLNQPLALEWTFNFTRFTFDYPIDEKEFLADT